jgi:hypothetical protein
MSVACGIIFNMSPTGEFTSIPNFTGLLDGFDPITVLPTAHGFGVAIQ